MEEKYNSYYASTCNLLKLSTYKVMDMATNSSSYPQRVLNIDDDKMSRTDVIKLFFSPPNEIQNGVYLGSAYNAAICQFDIIVNCAKEVPNCSHQKQPCITLNLPLEDSKEQNIDISDCLLTLRKLNLELKKNPSATVLFHCFAGRSRSAFLMTLYLMKKDPRLSVSDAYQMIKEKRSKVSMNTNFFNALLTLDEKNC